jgi:hypothetical protein
MNTIPDPGPAARRGAGLRPLLLASIVLVLVQSGIGMAVNLYVTVPARHPGARPAGYFTGSFRSVAWALGHGGTALAVHAALGLALAVTAIGVAARAIRSRRRGIAAWTVLAGLLVVGAGFNGASFLDFNGNISSLIMALLAFGSIACYAAALSLAGRPADLR